MSTSKKYHTKGEYSTNVVRVLHPTNPVNSSYTTKSSKSETWKDGEKISEYNVNYATRDGDVTDYSTNTLKSDLSSNTLRSWNNEPDMIKNWDNEPMIKDGNKNYKHYESKSYNSESNVNRPVVIGTNQLDNLLEDLKHEREITKIKDFNQKYISSSNLDDVSDENVVRSEIIRRTENHSTPYQPEIVNSSRTETYHNRSELHQPEIITSRRTEISQNRSGISGIVQPEIINNNNVTHSSNIVKKTTRTVNDGTFGNRSFTTNEVVTNSELPKDLQDIPVIDEILPPPGTKVKTTIRTYEYEIPQDSVPSSVHSTLLRQEQHNNYGQIRDINTTDRRSNTTSSHYKIVDSKLIPNTTTSNYTLTETNTINDNVNRRDVPHSLSPRDRDGPYDPNSLYDPNSPYDPNGPYGTPSGPHKTPPHPNGLGPKQTYYYKHESSNTKNTLYGPPSPPPTNEVTTYSKTTNVRNLQPHPQPQPQPQILYPVNSYPASPPSTHSERITEHHYYHDNSSTRPFPVDQTDHSDPNVVPPKRLDDLMATFPNGHGYSAHENDSIQKREINTSLAKAGTPEIERTPTKNVTGAPVYYPPGQEMTMRKEESAAAWRAQGGYAKASGKYEYGAESSSKSKSKSGAAVVPVCLPLCCAMPCSIM